MASPGSSSSKKVCVIGAGPSGLVAARELRKEAHSVVVLEQNHDIGGQWLYHPQVDQEHPFLRNDGFMNVHSSIYASMRLNTPREIMGFTDFPFFVTRDHRDTRRYPGHREFFLYLQDFCDEFNLRKLIRFNTRVENVVMLSDDATLGDGFKWLVKSETDDAMVEEVYDAVVVAAGHYSHPRLPEIKGMDSWKRKQMHSHIYRVPDPFKNEVVVVVGHSFSGKDISKELMTIAKEVHLSTRSPNTISTGLSKIISKYHNLILHPQIESLHEDGKVMFTDGSWTIADTIIYCTGYCYAFPFLDTKGIVTVDDNRVGPLYEHTFPPSLAPTLSFIGITRQAIGPRFFESQAKWIAQILSGKRKLPETDSMMQSIDDYYQSMDAAGIPKDQTHTIQKFEYYNKYADYVDFPHLEEWQKKLWASSLQNEEINLESYRDSVEEDEETLKALYDSHYFNQFRYDPAS